MSKGGVKQIVLGIWYDKDGNVKRVDSKGMNLEELIEALIERKKEQEEKLRLLGFLTQAQRKDYEEIEGEEINWESLSLGAIKIIIDELKNLKRREAKKNGSCRL